MTTKQIDLIVIVIPDIKRSDTDMKKSSLDLHRDNSLKF